MTTASRGTVLGGNAVVDAARQLKEAMQEHTLEELAGREFLGEILIDWTTSNDAPEPITHLAYGWATQVVLLDAEGRIEKVIAAHDVGRAINPTQVEGQIHGGIAQGLGMALMEAYVPGRTENLHDYLIPTVGDVPEIECLLIEDAEPSGPYGAKGVGEPALVPTVPAILGAIEAAVGVRMTTLPVTPDRLLAALASTHA